MSKTGKVGVIFDHTDVAEPYAELLSNRFGEVHLAKVTDEARIETTVADADAVLIICTCPDPDTFDRIREIAAKHTMPEKLAFQGCNCEQFCGSKMENLAASIGAEFYQMPAAPRRIIEHLTS